MFCNLINILFKKNKKQKRDVGSSKGNQFLNNGHVVRIGLSVI